MPEIAPNFSTVVWCTCPGSSHAGPSGSNAQTPVLFGSAFLWAAWKSGSRPQIGAGRPFSGAALLNLQGARRGTVRRALFWIRGPE